jgi:hypothetical protein
MIYKLIITTISVIGIASLGIGLRSSLGYLVNDKHYYTLVEKDVGMSLGSSLAITFLGIGIILTSIMLTRHEKIIGKL